jgi:hypothetical protein
VTSIGLRVKKGLETERFWGKVGQDVKRVSRNGIGEVRDNSEAISGIGSIIRRGVNGQGGVRKSRGRVRM